MKDFVQLFCDTLMCFVMVFIATANWKIPDQSSKKDTNNFHELCFSVLIVDFEQVLLHWESIYKNKKKSDKEYLLPTTGVTGSWRPKYLSQNFVYILWK